jgi:hypothetical protein
MGGSLASAATCGISSRHGAQVMTARGEERRAGLEELPDVKCPLRPEDFLVEPDREDKVLLVLGYQRASTCSSASRR